MELDSFPAELRKQAIEIGQVLKMEMFPEDSVKPSRERNPSLKDLSLSAGQMTVECWPLFW